MSESLARLATEALADAERGTPGPWRWGDWRTSWGMLESEFRMTLEFNPTYRGEQAPIVRERDTNEAVRVLTVESEIGEADRAFIATARTREPLLAAGVLDLTRQLAEANTVIAHQVHQLADARAENAELRSDPGFWGRTAARLSDENLQLREQLATARAALSEACDLLAIARLGDSPPLREQADVIRKRGGL